MTDEEILQFIEMADRYKLATLDLSNVEVTTLSHNVSRWNTLPPEIGKLNHLKELNLTGNGLLLIPEELFLLENLETLCLNNNRISVLSSGINKLKKLKKLSIRFNNLTALPAEITDLVDLRFLDLGHNSLTILPDTIQKLSNLIELHLESNKLTTIPPVIGSLPNIKALSICGNTFSSFPPEILGAGTKAVLDYFKAQLIDSSKRYECKLFVVGKRDTGKKTLLKSLQDKSDEDVIFKKTKDLISLYYKHPEHENVKMKLNICDFGKLEIFHATHKYLLTKRTLFLVTWNSFYGFEYAKLYDLLDAVKSKTPTSPILIVATHIDERNPDIPTEDLKTRYPQIIGFFNVSNLTGSGMEILRNAIITTTASLPLMGEVWPTSWLKTITTLGFQKEYMFSLNKIDDLMKSNGVVMDHSKTVLKWLHELGIILYFSNDSKLNSTVFVNLNWLAKQIIDVLESEEIVKNAGILTEKQLETVWLDLDPFMRENLCNLMQKFDVAFPQTNNKEYAVVEHLPLESLNYKEEWINILKSHACKEISMKFYFNMALPIGIPIWFITRVRRFLTKHHWQNGALMADNKNSDHLALLQTYIHDRYLQLTVRGPFPWDFFCLLRDGLELTFERFPGLNVKRTIPCECNSQKNCDYNFDYDQLIKRISNNPPKKMIECLDSLEKVSIPYMIFGINRSSYHSILKRIKKLITTNSAQTVAVCKEIQSLQKWAQREYLKQFYNQQSSEELQIPNIFAIRIEEKQDEPLPIFNNKMSLKLYCQMPGCWHPTKQGGLYQISTLHEWLQLMEIYLVQLSMVLESTLPTQNQSTNIENIYEVDKDSVVNDLRIMNKIVHKLPELKNLQDQTLSIIANSGLEINNIHFKSLHKLLHENDPDHDWGGLKKVITPEGDYLWLCDYHANLYS